MDITLPIWPAARRCIQTKNPMISRNGKSSGIRLATQFEVGVLYSTLTFCSENSCWSASLGHWPGGAVDSNLSTFLYSPEILSVLLLTVNDSTLPSSICWRRTE